MKIAAIAPSFPLFFGCSGGQLAAALRLAGFSVVEETASVLSRYHNLLAERIGRAEAESAEAGGATNEGVSLPPTVRLCPGAARLARLEFPWLAIPQAALFSAMEMHGSSIRRRYPRAYRVFISPCPEKAEENRRKGSFHEVQTFEDIAALFRGRGIDPAELEQTPFDRTATPVERLSVLSAPVSGPEACRRFSRRESVPASWERSLRGLPGKRAGAPTAGRAGALILARSLELCLCEGGCAGMAAASARTHDGSLTVEARTALVVRHALSGSPEPERLQSVKGKPSYLLP